MITKLPWLVRPPTCCVSSLRKDYPEIAAIRRKAKEEYDRKVSAAREQKKRDKRVDIRRWYR
jgi:hypothetical protein